MQFAARAGTIVEGIPVSRFLIGREVEPFRSCSDYEYDIFSSVRITKVYQGDLEAGGEITLSEGCRIYGSDTNTLVSVYYNMPSEIGKKYLFFLNKSAVSEDDIYGLCVYETGRYPVIDPEEPPIESMSYQDFYISFDMSGYRALYAEVAEKYMCTPRP